MLILEMFIFPQDVFCDNNLILWVISCKLNDRFQNMEATMRGNV